MNRRSGMLWSGGIGTLDRNVRGCAFGPRRAAAYQRQPFTDEELALAAAEDWGPAEDWSDLAVWLDERDAKR